MKKCIGCGQLKSLDEYYVHARMADGHLNECKVCICGKTKKRRDGDVEEHRRRDRKRYYEQPQRQEQARQARLAMPEEKKAEGKKRWIENNPEKRRAHVIVGNAVRDGKLKKEPCNVCGNPRAQAHHKDYSKPLEVRWLCQRCHMLAHRKGA